MRKAERCSRSSIHRCRSCYSAVNSDSVHTGRAAAKKVGGSSLHFVHRCHRSGHSVGSSVGVWAVKRVVTADMADAALSALPGQSRLHPGHYHPLRHTHTPCPTSKTHIHRSSYSIPASPILKSTIFFRSTCCTNSPRHGQPSASSAGRRHDLCRTRRSATSRSARCG